MRIVTVRDLLPASDRAAALQVAVMLAATAGAAWLPRRERALVLLAVGVGMVVLGLMAMRTLH
ncbi:MAG: hypothetical protein R8G01_06895 [Ilumatobacteraceae bacterium]|nr:hypothetical protein [Ilumatobacteraceae bacterium]